MPDGPSRSGNPFDQATLHHAGRESTEGLISLKCQLRQVVQRGSRVSVEMAKRVPLHERDAMGYEFCIDLPTVSHL